MLALLSRFLPSTPALLAVVFLTGLLLGGWGTYKIVRAGEVRALQGTIRDIRANHRDAEEKAAQTAGEYLIAVEEQRRVNRQLQRKLRDAITSDPVCNFSADAVRLLNNARGYRLPEATAEPATENATAGEVSSRSAADSWLFDISQYEICRARLSGLIDYVTR